VSRALPVILQTEAAECGLACLAMISSFHGHRIDLNTLRRRYPISLKGVTLRSLVQIAGEMSLSTRALRYELGRVSELQVPAILHWDMNHFVVLRQVTRRGIIIHDPARGECRMTMQEASNHATGVALELTPTVAFTAEDERQKLPLSAFFTRNHGVTHALVQVLGLSVVLELLVVASPLYLQLAVDQVVAYGDADLLVVLALGFGLLAAIQVATTAIRSLVILSIQNALHYQIGARLFHHLIRLPLGFFEKRHIGDVLSRFTSIEPIRNLIAEGMIAAVIDGLMALATLVMLFVYSIKLALIVSAAFLLYIILRFAMFRMFWRRSEESIRTKAQQDSMLIETMRAVQSLKLFNRESEREEQWLNRYVDFVSANVRLGRVKIAFKTINDAIFAVENVITIYLAARLALDGALTVGMVFAFISYKRNFTDKASLLVEKCIEYRIIGLHLNRLGDIAMSALEAGHDRPLSHVREIIGKVELRGVSFRYAESEPLVLENVNLVIEPGQFATIMGPSGGGKTTLVKIMLGLFEPTSGEVLIDDIPLGILGRRAYREQVAAVMQEDQLVSGSIADNICFFDTQFDHSRMVECAELAAVHEEIMRMPMGYHSLIGDMGSSLSGGQKQRILLARALYRQPKILFLDEGTAHLDVDTERRINANLRQLNMTRVNIAHRPDISSGADSVFRVADKVIGTAHTATELSESMA
jgi:ATP-binding cassette, subfamily B, bacterial CvaB/MchF/RaxB